MCHPECVIIYSDTSWFSILRKDISGHRRRDTHGNEIVFFSAEYLAPKNEFFSLSFLSEFFDAELYMEAEIFSEADPGKFECSGIIDEILQYGWHAPWINN